MAFDHSPSLEPQSGDRSEPGGVSPRSPRWHDQIPCLVPHTGNRVSVVRALVSTRRGSEESVTNAPFWPGACATRLQHAAPFGSWLQGPVVKLQRGHGDEPWKTSSATNGTRSACPSFRLDPQWSGYGPILPTQAQGPQPNLTSRIATVRGCANHDAMRLLPDGRDSNTLPQNRL